jgi:hypothetical protein
MTYTATSRGGRLCGIGSTEKNLPGAHSGRAI